MSRISALHLAEDHAVLRALGPAIHLRNPQLLDTPLRLGIADTTLLDPPLASAERLTHTQQILTQLPPATA